MNKLLKRFIYATGIMAVILVAGCKDDLEEIKTLDTSRLFSPTDVETRIINQTSVRLSWNPVKKALSYNIEFFEGSDPNFSGTPFKVLQGITYDQIPITVPGFDGETNYTVRIKAIGEGIDDSKWITATFKTGAEQIFFPVDPADIEATSVILRWPAGETATHVNLEPGAITHQLTADEITAGAVTISNLVSETEYTAKLMNGEKVRGTITFTTLIDIGGATLVNPGDDLKALVEAANPDDAFALMPGEYTIADNININNTITIFGVRPNEKPIITGAVFRMKNGSGLRLKDILADGATAPDGNQMVIYEEVMPYDHLIIEDCHIKSYVKGVIYGSIAALVESVMVKGNIIADVECVGGDFIDFRSGMTKKFDFVNNTVTKCALNRDLFRMDNATAYSGSYTAIITIENNTFYKIISTEGTTRRVLYIRLASHEIIVKKNIFSETLANYSNQAATTVVEFSSNNYHNSPNLYSPSFTVYDSGNYYTLNPGFANPEAGNFTLSNEDLIFYGIGDPRWLP